MTLVNPLIMAMSAFLDIVQRLPVSLVNFMSLSALLFAVIVLFRVFNH